MLEKVGEFERERERERERTMFTKMGEERKNRFTTSGL